MTRSDPSLLGRWLRARVRIQLRTGRAVVFTFAFPLVLILPFNGLNGNAKVGAVGAAGQVPFAQFYTPSIGIFSVTTACYTSVIIGIATARDSGLLKRVKGTPLPMSIYLGSWLTGAALTGIVAVVLLFAVAVPAFGVHVYAATLPAAIVTLVLGAACLASVGLAVATLAKTADQATPDRAAHVPARLVHLRHLVPARRRAGLADEPREGLPARAHRPRLRPRLLARCRRRRVVAGRPVVDRGVDGHRPVGRDAPLPAEPAAPDAAPRRSVLRRAG
jgi:ABC-2 type transporter